MRKTVLLIAAAMILLTGVMAFAGGGKEAPAMEGPKKFRVAVSLPPANNAWQAKLLDSVLAETKKDTGSCLRVISCGLLRADTSV